MPPRLHAVITTHTTRHLAACVGSLCLQTDPPETVAVSSDADDPAIEDLLRRARHGPWSAAESRGWRAPRLLYTARPHQGIARPSQARNNGVRAILASAPQGPADALIILDGDIVLHPEACARHRDFIARGVELVVPFRADLTDAATASVDVERLTDAQAGPSLFDALCTPSHRRLLADRDRRYRRQLFWKRLGLTKPHKPKVISAHHGVSLGRMLEVNGYDEAYEAYGCEDDDLALRLHKAGARAAVAVTAIPALHLWHPTRATAPPTQTPGYARFTRGQIPMRAELGIDSPRDQPQPRIVEIA